MKKIYLTILFTLAASVGMSWATTTDLASISNNYTAQDGEILTGTLGVNVKISIADGATVTLLNANINGDKTWTTGDYAGLTCLGDATITIVGKNSVSGFSTDNGYPGIYVPSGKTLIINGTGSLTAQSSTEEAAGIGARKNTHCGNIEIQSGKITAIAGGEEGAGIGGAFNANCGNITISGGIVTAVGGYRSAGIGGGRRSGSTNAGHCGNILISGGVVSATSGADAAAIGGGRGNNNAYKSNCGTITITNTALKVYADQGGSSTNTIGAAKYGTCGQVKIGDNTGVINNDPYTFRTKEDGDIVVDYINAIGTVVYTQECKDKIDIARELYDALEDSQKDLVTNYQTLLDAEATYAAIYTVAGSSAAVFGTTWDVANDNNDMVLDEGVFKFAKENVVLAAGTIEFKVVTNHSWDNTSYPVNNYVLNIPEAGKYNIAISFDYSQGNSGVSATATFVEPVVVLPTVSIAGDFNSWSTSANVLVDAANHLTCSGTISLTPGWYDFKVVRDGSWLSVGPGEYDEGDKHQMSRRYTTKEGLTTGRKNLLLLVDIAGDYEFVFTYATNDLVISVPNFVRAAANTNYQSLCTPFDATIDGATAYTVGTASASGVSINPVVGNLEAGHSYIIKPAAVGTISINYVTDGEVTINSVEPNGTGLYGVLIEDYVYSYAYESTKDNPWVNVFALLNDDMFHQVVSGGEVTITPTHAYLHIEGQEIVPNPGAPGIRIIETATNIENIEGNETAVKFIENGKLFIKKNGIVYDAVGTVVK